MIKFTIIFASTCFLLFGFSLKQNNVKLVEATSEKWISGQNGGGSGTEYFMKIKILTDQKIVFDSLWFNNKSLPTYLSQTNSSISSEPVSFVKNDIVVVRVSDLSSSANKIIKPPLKYKGEGILRYFVNGKAFYLIIKKFKQIPSINRP